MHLSFLVQVPHFDLSQKTFQPYDNFSKSGEGNYNLSLCNIFIASNFVITCELIYQGIFVSLTLTRFSIFLA